MPAHPVDLHPVKCLANPLGVHGRHLSIVDFIQHGGDAIEREKDLELGYEADAPRVASEPRDGTSRRVEEREPLASRVDKRRKAAGQQRCYTHNQPHEQSDPAPHFGAAEALAGPIV